MPVHSEEECVLAMCTIAKVTCKPFNAALRGKLDKVIEKYQTGEHLIQTLQIVGLTENGIQNHSST